MIEIWKDIPTYEGHYQASNHGRIRSIKSTPRILVEDLQPNGYKRVYLWKNGKKKNKLVHRLVALTFISNCENYTDVNHIDEDKTNNVVTNLQWCSRFYNMNYGSVKERIGKANRGKIATKETRIKLGNNTRNRKWMNKGNVERLIKQDDISFFANKGWELDRKECLI
ncbi:NUMOD4 domain-containing protein [Streptococcus suis]